MSDKIPVPSVELLVKELKEVTDWILFGVSLGVPVRKLNNIKLDDPHGGVENWKIELFHFWLRLKPDASWKDVVQALEQNDYGVLAARVKRVYMLGKNTDEEDELETEVHADANVVRQLRDLETSFCLMLSRFGSILKECDEELSEARTFLNRACGSRDFSDCKNIDELLDQLCRDHIDPFNLYRLYSLLEIFESKKEVLDKVIKKYEEEKESFLKSTTVSQFQRAIVEKVEPMLQKGKVLVTIKILKKMKCALKDIENLALEGFEDSQQYLVRMHAKTGSVIISWVLLDDHSCELEKSVRKNAAVFKKSGVEEVTIGGKIFFPLEENIAPKEVYTDFYHRLVEAVSDKHSCQSLLTQFSSSALISEEKIAQLSSSKVTGSSFLKTLGLEEEPHILVPLVNAMSRVEQMQTLAEKMSTMMKSKQGKQQLKTDIEKLTSDNADLLTRLQCCEKELKEVTELSIMREKAVSGMMAAREKDQLESTMAVAKKVSESNQGAEVCGETVFEVMSDKLPQNLEWHGYGFKIIVPVGALSPGMTARVAVKVILRGQFSLPEDSELVSAIYWISCSEVLLKEVAIYIQHCAVISNEKETKNLRFVVAESDQDKFISKEGIFDVKTQYATIQRKSFSFFAIVKYFLGLDEKKYRALKFYQNLSDSSVDAKLHFVVLTDLDVTISEYQKIMEQWEMRGRMQPIKFSGEHITLELKQPLCADNWMISPESTPLKICKCDVDNYNLQKCDDSISCIILLQWKGEEGKAKPLKSHILPILGTTEEDCSFTIHHYFQEKSRVNEVPNIDERRPKPSSHLLNPNDDLKRLINELKDVTDWYNFGINLGMEDRILKSVQRNTNNHEVTDMMSDMLTRWLKYKPDAAWEDVVSALRYMDENRAAKIIEDRYCATSS